MKPSSPKPETQPSAYRSPEVNRIPGSPETRKNRKRPKSTDVAGSESPYAESLLEACAAQPRLRLFAVAIDAAGLGDLLNSQGPITIFAPTDRAFEKIPSGELSALMGDAPRLAGMIRRHVVTGRVKAPKQAKSRTVTSQAGADLELTASLDGFHVDAARIVKTNIRATNGVIHAIDTVLGVN